jgi:hypothetical protein
MQITPFYYWLFGIILLIGIGVILSLVFGKKREKPAYNFRDEKRVLAEEISKELQPIYKFLKTRFVEMNPLKLKKIKEESYELESRSIVTLLENCGSKSEVFKMMDEEFYRWNWSSPLYDEFYDALEKISEEVWQELHKKD